jgi:hypothetical protein
VLKPEKSPYADYLASDASVWKQYLDVARSFDTGSVEVWDKGLDALLVFVSYNFCIGERIILTDARTPSRVFFRPSCLPS